ncbi:MAG: hypothetical protein NE334_08690 [Lentisphaeraceae bacterium]|nr:hypothetical protein [Lentisphaeraceae bacterium]
MNKFLNIFLAATSIAFAALYFSDSEAAKAPVSSDEKASTEDANKLKVQNKLLEQEVAKLQKELDLLKQLPERVVKVTQEAPVAENTGATPALTSLQKMFNEPQIQEMMKKRRDAMVQDRYGSIIAKLNLSDADKEKLMTILGDKQLLRMQGFMRMRAAETDEEKEEIKLLMEDQQIENDNQVADLLGDKYETYTDYESKRDQYRVLESMNKKLNESSLTESQTDELASIMKETSDSYKFSNAEVAANPRLLRDMSEEDREIYKLEVAERNAQIIEQASTVLTPEQLEEFTKEQTRQSSRNRGGRGRRGR